MSARPPLRRGDVVLVQFPFTDLSATKVRPALIVGRVIGNDLVLAFVSSNIGLVDAKAEVLLEPTDPELPQTGLKVPSVIRLQRLATLHRALTRRRIGRIGLRGDQAVATSLRYVFELS